MLALVLVTNVQAGRPQSLYLDWRQVVPSGSGDPNMIGNVNIDVNPGQTQLCYTLRVFIYASFLPPTGAIIGHAPAGENGPLAVDLQLDFEPIDQPETSGRVNLNSALAHDIQRNPTQYYILLTDTDHPEGASRAQFSK
jgi:CHRD domain